MRENLGELLILAFSVLLAVSTLTVPIIRWLYGS
jgi:hypothetical protein